MSSKIVEFKYYSQNSEKNIPQSDWINNISQSIFSNYNKYESSFLIDKIIFQTNSIGLPIKLFYGQQSASLTANIFIGNTGIYEIDVKEMNKNILLEKDKVRFYGFEISKNIEKYFLIITIIYRNIKEEEEEI